MKSAIVAVLQERMGKCTGEQIWAVAVVAAVNLSVVIKPELIPSAIPPAGILAVTALVTLYAVVYCVERHCAYYRNRQALAELLRGEPNVPAFLIQCPRKWAPRPLLGLAFQVALILGSWLLSALASR